MGKIRLKDGTEFSVSSLFVSKDTGYLTASITSDSSSRVFDTISNADTVSSIQFCNDSNIVEASYSDYTDIKSMTQRVISSNGNVSWIVDIELGKSDYTSKVKDLQNELSSANKKIADMTKSLSDSAAEVKAIKDTVAGVVDVDALDLDGMRSYKQSENKRLLAEFLAKSNILFNDKLYGVTEEDQNEMAMQLVSYQLAAQVDPDALLEWHAIKEECTKFTIEEFTALVLQIKTFVYPYMQYMQSIKAEIYNCDDIKAIKAMTIDYDSAITQN